jgi:hypothetical protein
MQYRNTVKYVALAALLLTAAGVAGAAAPVAYPDGYRNWYHVKSMVLFDDHPLANPFAGIHHVYANDKALAGLRNGKYADGAVIAFDLFTVKSGGGALQEGPRKLLGVMVKDAKTYAQTGGWGFEGFAGDSKSERLVKDGGKGCFDCHTQVTDKDYVFSALRP